MTRFVLPAVVLLVSTFFPSPASAGCSSTRIMANPVVTSWMKHFFGRNVTLRHVETSPFPLSTPCYTGVNLSDWPWPVHAPGGRYSLSRDVPVMVSSEGVVELGGEPDSFVYLYVWSTGELHRVVQMGSYGRIVNAAWLSSTEFVVLGLDRGESGEAYRNFWVDCFDLAAGSEMLFSVDWPKPASDATIDAYLLDVYKKQVSGPKK